MNNNVEQILTSLIPTFNDPLPPELLDLAVSLLARSRSVATSLKPDEEIARPYACCQLACERLKKRLNLPTITSRPPCPPRIYKKLYAYLDSSLPRSTSQAPETPKKTRAQASTTAANTPKTPLSGRRTPKSVAKEKSTSEPPEWCMPVIRDLCKAYSYPNATPHVFVGLSSILPLQSSPEAPETPSRKRPRRTTAPAQSTYEVSDLRVLSLIAVVLFYTLSRMLDQDISPEQFLQWRNKAVSTLCKSKIGENFSEADILAEIELLMPMAQEGGWLQMEWYLNITPNTEGGEPMEGVEMTDGNVSTGKTGRENGLGEMRGEGGSEYIGLGTMMQDATDFLAERRREEYRRWKTEIIAMVEEIEASS
ncbi:hypothetical protein GQ43DRAFT_414254 [Delitschia confertaspora ATCC 74209]|uniref:ORC6 first cyclin-like domain-containing protein n=1 Tax=Delitschia confertaspora ATCC 74209 TaxID=1513339 RepID=A0A9P4MWG8_9PLEO|nr:hypothetical protein GQ43DRAFT_414254 [Delitschia confertaspora ATCC 74209]